MKISQLFSATKKDYLSYTLIGIAVTIIYFTVMVNWMGIVRIIVGNSDLIYDRQPAIFKSLHACFSYLLFIIVGILLIRGFIKKNLVMPVSMALGFFLCYAGLIGWLFLGPVITDYTSRTAFNAAEWQNNDKVNSKSPVRIRMVDDLLKNQPLIGKSKGEINTLLGIPPKTGYFSEFDYVYWLGPERGFLSIDSEWLAIKFNNDVVIEARIMRD